MIFRYLYVWYTIANKIWIWSNMFIETFSNINNLINKNQIDRLQLNKISVYVSYDINIISGFQASLPHPISLPRAGHWGGLNEYIPPHSCPLTGCLRVQEIPTYPRHPPRRDRESVNRITTSPKEKRPDLYDDLLSLRPTTVFSGSVWISLQIVSQYPLT